MESLLRAVFDASTCGIIVLDSDGRVVLWNLWMEKHSGITAEQAQGAILVELFEDRIVPRVHGAINSALRYRLSSLVSESIHKAPFPLYWEPQLRSGGDRLPHNVAVKSIVDVSGQRYCVLQLTELSAAVSRDQFLRQQAQELEIQVKRHQRAEARYRAVLDTAADGIISLYADGMIEGVNGAAERIFGHPAELMVGRHCSEFFVADPRFLEPGGLAMLAARTDARVLDTVQQVEGQHTDGHRIPLEVSISETLLDNGPLYTLIVRDISCRMASEAALRESEQRFRMMADAAPVLLWMADASMQCIYFNQPWLAFTGRQLQQEVGAGWTEGVHPDDREACVNTYTQSCSVREPFEIEYRLRHHDGEYRWILDKGVPRYTPDGSFLGYIGSCLDISTRHAAEDVVRKAGELALRYAQAKAEFVANVSHELRTPMNGVLGMLELLAGTDLDAEQRDYAEIARHSGISLLEIINNVLDFSKLEAGGVALETIDYSPATLVEGVVESFAVRAAAKSVDLVCDLPAELPELAVGDPNRIRQVLLNLVGNAIKFTEQGEITVVVRTVSAQDSGQNVLRFAVVDTGIGISASAIPVIFDHFTQADVSTTRRYGGTGLGLAISRQLAEMMGGRIGVNSELGRGSTFWLEIPFLAGHADRPSAAEVQDLHNRRVLLVGVPEKQATAFGRQLGSLGLVCVHCDSAPAAQRLLTAPGAAAFAYVFLHVGTDLAEAAALWPVSAAHAQAIPCFAVLGVGQLALAKQAASFGFAGAIALPTRTELVRERILSAMTPLISPPGMAGAPVDRLHPPILVVDDVTVNCRVAAGLLRRRGYEVDTVESGAAALAAFQNRRYGLIFMDCQMPDMDGYATTAKLRELPGGKDVAIVALTASTSAGSERRCLEVGMNDYLLKPFAVKRLEKMTEKWLPRAQTRQDELAGPQGTEAAPLGAPTLDVNVLQQLRQLMGDTGYEELVRVFVAETNDRLAVIADALAERNWETLQRAGHSLKGAASNMAAFRLAALAKDLEEQSKTCVVDRSVEIVAAIEVEFTNLQPQLRLAG